MKTSKLYPKRAKDIKGKVAIAELRRAHYIIALLALSFVFLLIITMTVPMKLDQMLGSIASALLIIVAAASLITAITLRK